MNVRVPLWLQQQYEQLAEAAVHGATSDMPPCTLTQHVFNRPYPHCRCGRMARSEDAQGTLVVTISEPMRNPPRERTLADVAHIEPGGLSDDDVRRLEHPGEYADE